MLRFSSVSDGADGRSSGGQRGLHRSEIRSPLPDRRTTALYRRSAYHPPAPRAFSTGDGDPPYEQRNLLPVAECEGGPGWFRIRDPGVLGGGLEVPDARRVLAEDLRLDLCTDDAVMLAFALDRLHDKILQQAVIPDAGCKALKAPAVHRLARIAPARFQ